MRIVEEKLGRVFAALANPTRRAIVLQLKNGPRRNERVSRLAKTFPLSRAGFRRHVQVLKRAGILQGGRSIVGNRYRLDARALKVAEEWLHLIP